MGVFETHAPRYAEKGLVVIPCGGGSGKAPRIKSWQNSSRTLDWMCRTFPDCNLGIHTGPSDLTVVDVDKEKLIQPMIDRFGPTPVMARTPRGGAHLWYRANGEPKTNLNSENLKVDIQAEDSLIICPPSVRPDGAAYRFVRGGLDDMDKLPHIRPGSLTARQKRPKQETYRPAPQPTGQGRNDALFKAVKDFACRTAITNLDQLLDFAREKNRTFSSPLPDAEVAKIAGSVWKMHQEGRLLGSGARGLVLSESVLSLLMEEHPNVLKLYSLLRFNISRDSAGFAIGLEPLAKKLNMGKSTVARARDRLIACGLVTCIYQGGDRRGDASQYVWTDTG